jgi:hypothetical protein
VQESTPSSTRQFGILIAYVLPGFIALAGVAPIFPAVARWLRPVGDGDLSLGPPLYAVLAATTLGLILSCFRWLLLDELLHRWTGVRRPIWDDRRLADALGAFNYLAEQHFRYAEFSGNAMLATVAAYAVNRGLHTLPFLGVGTDAAVVILTLVLFAASRDALAKYYARTGRLVGLAVAAPATSGDAIMFNGNDHGGATTTTQPKPEGKNPPEANAPVQPSTTDAKPNPPQK